MIYYLIIMNTITFITYGMDKYKSIKHKYRISEATLIILASLGGPLGAFFGMITFHHKTRKKKFVILIPLLLILWIWILVKFD